MSLRRPPDRAGGSSEKTSSSLMDSLGERLFRSWERTSGPERSGQIFHSREGALTESLQRGARAAHRSARNPLRRGALVRCALAVFRHLKLGPRDVLKAVV